MNIQDIFTHTLRALDGPPSSAATVRKPYVISQDKNEAPTADAGTAGVSTHIVRYWTVKYECGGRSYYDHVEACDAWKAGLVVFRRHDGATSTQVVREINREEFEHLTRVSP